MWCWHYPCRNGLLLTFPGSRSTLYRFQAAASWLRKLVDPLSHLLPHLALHPQHCLLHQDRRHFHRLSRHLLSRHPPEGMFKISKCVTFFKISSLKCQDISHFTNVLSFLSRYGDMEHRNTTILHSTRTNCSTKVREIEYGSWKS